MAWNGLLCATRLVTGVQELMNKKDLVGDLFNQLRLRRQRSTPPHPDQFSKEDAELEDTLGQMLMVLDQLDSLIGMLWHHVQPDTGSFLSAVPRIDCVFASQRLI